jgi:hypothetical protein
MEHDFDTLHGSILLKANDSVNRARQAQPGAANGGFAALAHAIGHCGVMCMKDYFHF